MMGGALRGAVSAREDRQQLTLGTWVPVSVLFLTSEITAGERIDSMTTEVT
jgi:hypothetical protein